MHDRCSFRSVCITQIKMAVASVVFAGNQAAASPSNGGSSGAMNSAASPTPLKSEEDEVDKESEREKEHDLPPKKHDSRRSTLDHHADAGSSYSNSVSTATASSSAANGTVQPEEVKLCLSAVATIASCFDIPTPHSVIGLTIILHVG